MSFLRELQISQIKDLTIQMSFKFTIMLNNELMLEMKMISSTSSEK